MNRHLYGATKGIPLENLEKLTWARTSAGGLLWIQLATPKIIDDELFLCFTHTIEGKVATLREAIEKGRHSICMHVATDPVDSVHTDWDRTELYKIPELQKTGSDQSNKPPHYRACRDIEGTCAVCLTDYTTTIERTEVREARLSKTAKNRVSVILCVMLILKQGVELI